MTVDPADVPVFPVYRPIFDDVELGRELGEDLNDSIEQGTLVVVRLVRKTHQDLVSGRK